MRPYITRDTAQRFLLSLVLFFLLVACSTSTGGTSNGGSTPIKGLKLTPALSLTPAPTSPATMTDECPSSADKSSYCLTPHALRVTYGIESLFEKGFTGKGQTVIDIVSFGSPTLQEDMDAYDRQYGLPPIDLQIIAPLTDVKEYDPRNDKAGWADETTLDVQMIHALAPGARVVVLVSPVAETEGTIGLPEFLRLEQYAIDNKLGYIVSHSWGASELTLQDTAGQAEIKKWDDFLQKATTQQNMTYFTSSGDNGATDFSDLNGRQLSSVPTTGFPADEPWSVGVGGTTVIRNGDNVVETAWTDQGDGGSSGGGFSKFYAEPSFQKSLPASDQSLLNNRRGVPDVAACADPRQLSIYLRGQWQVIGGTSGAAPMWAAIMAIANQMAGHPLGFINPTLYKLGQSSTYTQDFRDITVGNNTNSKARVQGYQATQSWDPVTGLGTPLAEKLIPDLIAAMK